MEIKKLLLIVIIFSCYATSTITYAKSVRVLRLCEKTVARALVSPRGTVFSFPTKPTKIILGKNSSFGIEFVSSDLVISPLASNSRSNLFVYLQGRRFVFDLITSVNQGYTIYLARDCKESQIKVNQDE